MLKESKNELEFELVGEDHAFCNALRRALNDNEDVLVATYKVTHPLLSSPRMLIKTKNIQLPVKAQKIVPLSEVPGVAAKREEQLRKAGIKSANSLAKVDPKKLAKKAGIPLATAESLVQKASKMNFWKGSIPRYVLKKTLKDLAASFSGIKLGKAT